MVATCDGGDLMGRPVDGGLLLMVAPLLMVVEPYGAPVGGGAPDRGWTPKLNQLLYGDD